MAERGMSASVKTEIAKPANRPCHLVSLHFDSGTTYITDYHRKLTYDSNDYLAFGSLLGATDIEETSELMVSSMTLSMSGIDQTMISAFLSDDYIDRTVKIYKAHINDSGAVIADPILIFEGRMDEPVIEEDPDAGSSSVQLKVTNQFTDFLRKPGRHTNHEEQQVHFPGDMGFEFASEIIKDIKWGRA